MIPTQSSPDTCEGNWALFKSTICWIRQVVRSRKRGEYVNSFMAKKCAVAEKWSGDPQSGLDLPWTKIAYRLRWEP